MSAYTLVDATTARAPEEASVPEEAGAVPLPGLHAVSRRLKPARAARDVRMAAG
jgi:hypothetical protein